MGDIPDRGDNPSPLGEDTRSGDAHLPQGLQPCSGEHVGMERCTISHGEFIKKSVLAIVPNRENLVGKT